MLVFRMLLKSEVVHWVASEMSPRKTRTTTYAGGLVVVNCGMWQDDFLELPLGRGMKKGAHKGLFTDSANNVFGLFVRLQLAPSTLRRVLFSLARARLRSLSTL